MIVPNVVLAIVDMVNRELNQTYGLMKRLNNADRAPNESLDVARVRLEVNWDELGLMRE